MARGAFDSTALLASILANQWLDEDAPPVTADELNPFRVSKTRNRQDGRMPYNPAVLEQIAAGGKFRV